MDYTLHHRVGAASPEAADLEANRTRPVVKIGLDVHALFYMAVAQHDHATPGAPRRFTPEHFVPWVSSLIAAGNDAHVVYEGCGFGFGLQRALTAVGAQCHVISPQAEGRCRTPARMDGSKSP